MKSYMAKPGEVAERWGVVDADGKIVGRLAAAIAPILMGKHRPQYTPHVECGDSVIVINAQKVQLTGKKWEQKTYERYSGYPGGRRTEPAWHLLQRKPEEILRLAVRRMLPKNKLAHRMINKLKIYAGTDHPHQAQQPEPLELEI